MFRKLLSAVTSTAVVAGLVTAGAVATATPAAATVPPPESGKAVVSVKVGGDRTGINGVARTKDVQLQLYRNNSGAPGTAIADAWGTCISDGDGDCSFQVPIGTTGITAGSSVWVKFKSAPTGWYGIDSLRVGSIPTPGTPVAYQFQTPGLQSGSTYRSGTQFMTDTGLTSNTASGGIWQISRNNPAFPPKCGIKVALLLDVSGSVGSNLKNLKNAAKTFVDSLVGTPSQVALYTFAQNAPSNNTNNQNRPLTPVLNATGPQSAQTVKDWIGTGNNGDPGQDWTDIRRLHQLGPRSGPDRREQQQL